MNVHIREPLFEEFLRFLCLRISSPVIFVVVFIVVVIVIVVVVVLILTLGLGSLFYDILIQRFQRFGSRSRWI
jgi:hypothetical protein